MFLTSLIFVELVELYTLHGERPPAFFNFQARPSYLRCNQSDNSGNGAIIDILQGFLVRLLFFHCMPVGRHALQTADAFVWAHDYRAVRIRCRQPNRC